MKDKTRVTEILKSLSRKISHGGTAFILTKKSMYFLNKMTSERVEKMIQTKNTYSRFCNITNHSDNVGSAVDNLHLILVAIKFHASGCIRLLEM